MHGKINIIQFMPYFPPHKGGLETVGEEIGKHWIKHEFGTFINLITHFEQDSSTYEKIVLDEVCIGYKKDGYEVLVVSSIEIINNFPIYKIWSKEYRLVKKYLAQKIGNHSKEFRVFTHTRFFLTSLIGGLFARKHNIKWIHIEHGSDYVKLSSAVKNKMAYIYDRILGKYIFKKADKLLAISEACKKFMNRKFVEREVEIFYRGLEISEKIKIVENLKEKFNSKIIIGYVGRLYKWKNVESLINAYSLLDGNILDKIQLIIVGDGENFDKLKRLAKHKNIYFTGGKTYEEALSYQRQFDIHIHPSSPGGGLATTLLQAMSFGCMIVATPNEGADEVIKNNKNGFLLNDDSVAEIKRGIELGYNNLDKKKLFSIDNEKIIKNKFSWDNNILHLYNILK